MKKRVHILFAAALAAALTLGPLAIKLKAQDPDQNQGFDSDEDHSEFRGFVPGSIVLSGTVYVGKADTIIPGEVLPPGCLNTGPITNPNPATFNVPTLTGSTLAVPVSCGYSSDNGEAPNLKDNHNVWNNASTDPNFGVSSPIILWNLSPNGDLFGTLRVPSHEIVTSFSSKSELALNRSADGHSLTFMGYRGGPGCPTLTLNTDTNVLTQGTNVGPTSPTAANLIDVSASSTPGLCDPTNPTVASYVGATNPTAYYRAVAEVDARGDIRYTDGDAYSGDNSRASIKADNWLYYSVGNDNNGGLKAKTFLTTQLGYNLSHSTGAELFVPGAAPLVPPNNNMISYFISIPGDKPGKDTNFRGMTIFNDTLYVAKGSGGNGINTVYQLGTPGVLPTIANAPAGGLVKEPYTILPGFPNTSASTNNPGGDYPFGIWFANPTTLYVCDEGDLIYTPNQAINGQVNVADAGTLATAGLQKWVLSTPASGSPTWVREYVIQNGLNLGVPYSVPNYPASIEPAAGGCRNIIGVVNHDGTATIYAITSTISNNGDNGADPNKLVKVTDRISATQPATSGDLDKFVTIRSARAGEAFRGIALAPEDDR
ncbi:MAG: hypothetical protein WB607_19255 [Candidatus Acidiferrum sp.]|jgi:hypothetical protein